MASAVEYATYIIDLTDAMLEHRQGLNEPQVQRLQMIQRRTVDFLTDYMQHESSSLSNLLSYLGDEAPKPLRIIMGCCDMLLSGNYGVMQPAYLEAVQEILDCGYEIQNEVEEMYENLRDFMQNMGMQGTG